MPHVLVLLGLLLIAAALWLIAPLVLARQLELWELGLMTALASWLIAVWRRRRLRRRRDEVEALRDSALW